MKRCFVVVLFMVMAGCAPRYTLNHALPEIPISLPADSAAHYTAQTEWWYYTGHFYTPDNKRYGFELTFFKRITNDDHTPWWLGRVPAYWIKDVGMLGHFAITDMDGNRFVSSEIHNFYHGWDADSAHYHVSVGPYSAQGQDDGAHLLCAGTNGYEIELMLVPQKAAVMHGPGGIVKKGEGNANHYYSYTRMSVQGTLKKEKDTSPVKGQAWMDHEYGTMNLIGSQKGWDWFGLQMDDKSELMIYLIREHDMIINTSGGTYVYPDGHTLWLRPSDISVRTSRTWQSKKTGTIYPAGWEITITPLDLYLEVQPVMLGQEMSLHPVSYWEGAVDIQGQSGGIKVSGQGYVELVGYDKDASFDKLKM
ncbi:MAG: lipocalin family protein [Thermodesulfobacteriota bacterium]|nr:lipocalin family protein [Thermodesulfobacteriota bacterium]